MSDLPNAAERAQALLEKNTGSAAERAQVFATLAVAEAVDRLAARFKSVIYSEGDTGDAYLWVRVGPDETSAHA